MIPINKNPLGTEETNPYTPNEILCDINNGATKELEFYPGIYYIRGQGAGAGGGRNGYYGNGQGGGSGAGFEGYIQIKKYIKTTVIAGIGGLEAYNGNPGTDTKIDNILILGGGRGGIGENGTNIDNAGVLSFIENTVYEIINPIISSNGNIGLEATSSGSFVSGGNSILTNSGGGLGNSDATAPGAGGGGGYQWHTNGGNGMYGELLIKYIGKSM